MAKNLVQMAYFMNREDSGWNVSLEKLSAATYLRYGFAPNQSIYFGSTLLGYAL